MKISIIDSLPPKIWHDLQEPQKNETGESQSLDLHLMLYNS